MSDGFWKILALKGIKGGGDTPTQEKTVALDMANGNQIINPDDGKTMTQATVLKPATMVAGNIKSGVDIGGVVGTLQERLPEEEKTVTITENGTTEVNATDGKVMTKVVVTTNVAIDNKVGQIVDGTITELTATDLSGITLIRDYAFSNCSNLIDITIPDSVASIGTSAFRMCSRLTNVTILGGNHTIKDYAFNECSNIKAVHIADLVDWCNIDFEGVISNPLVYAKKLYLNNEYVTDLIIPNGVISIKDATFWGSDIVSVTISDSVTSIAYRAFSGCKNLTSIIIPNSVISIGNSAFAFCSNLANITIGSGIQTIGTSAFSDTKKPTVIMLATTPPSIQTSSFPSSTTKIIVPKGTGDTYKTATNWSAFADYIEEATV